MIITNLLGPIRLTAALLPRLLAQPRSAVLNVTSALAFLPKAQVPTYCATKAALHSYTQSLRFQLRNTAVQVIEIIPPGVQTGLRDERVNEPDAMPLDEYIAETMALLTEEPEATEIVVDATKPLRFAERDGVYEQLLHRLQHVTLALTEDVYRDSTVVCTGHGDDTTIGTERYWLGLHSRS